MNVSEAVEKFGSQVEVARLCGVVDSAVCNWNVRNGGRIPKHHAVKLRQLPAPTQLWICNNCDQSWYAYAKLGCPICRNAINVEMSNG